MDGDTLRGIRMGRPEADVEDYILHGGCVPNRNVDDGRSDLPLGLRPARRMPVAAGYCWLPKE